MTKHIFEAFFLLLLAALFAVMLLDADSYHRSSRLLPYLASIPGFVFCAILIGKVALTIAKERKTGPAFRFVDDFVKPVVTNAAFHLLLGLVAFALLIYLVGLMYALPLFIFLMMYMLYKESLIVSAIVALGGLAVYYFVFIYALGIYPYSGLFG